MFRIVEPAMAPETPAAPRTGRLALLGIMASLGLAAVVVMVTEQVDSSFHSVDALRAHVGVPVIAAAIPRIVTAVDERRRKRRMHVYAACSVVVLVLVVGLAWFIAAGNYELVSLLARRG